MKNERWLVQQYDLFKGWNTWVIYDEKIHADNEMQRRVDESPLKDKRSWRVVSEQKPWNRNA